MPHGYFDFSILLLAVVSVVWFGYWIYSADKENRVNKLFFYLAISIVVWLLFSRLGSIVKTRELALLFKKINFAALSPFFIIAYLFSLHFPQYEKAPSVIYIGVIIIGILLFCSALFTDFVVKSVEIEKWGTNIIGGEGFLLFNIIIVFLTGLIIFNLVRKYTSLNRREKIKIQYFLIGIFIYILLNIVFNIIFPLSLKTYRYDFLGDYSVILFLGFTAYAIVKHELFGIRVVITAIFVALIAILLALDALVFTDILSLQLVKGLILILFLYFGYLMIKSVIREIEQRQEIEKLSKAKSEFISIASHQLRTPLTAIKGYISMILEGTYGKVNPKIRSPMKKVYESNERLIALVNNLLSISRIESGKMAFNPEETSIEDLISEVIDIFRIEAKKKKLYLRFEKPARPLPKVFVDREKMVDVLSNVVSNCIKYTLKGGVTIKAEEIKDKVNKIRVTISDTGEGMTEEELSKMFQSFSRGMAGTKLYTQGAGLGLYVARKYMEMHKGKIWAESEGKGKGSTFYIELPTK